MAQPLTADAATRGTRDGGGVDLLVSLVIASATGLLVSTGTRGWHTIGARPAEFLGFLGLTALLQLMAVNVYGRGSTTVSGIGLLAIGFTFGVAPAMAVAVAAATFQGLRARSRIHRALFNAGTFALAAAGGTAAYHVLGGHGSHAAFRVVPAFTAGVVLWLVNIGLVTLGMALAEGHSLAFVWRERFRWVTPYYLSFGPLALASVLAYERVGFTGLLAFAVPPALLMLSVRQYLNRTREAVEEVRQANDGLLLANRELAQRNEDLRELFEFAARLAAQAHDREGLIRYAEAGLTQLTGSEVRVSLGLGEAGGDILSIGGHPLGSVHVGESERWERLRDAVVPQLATALESAELVERIRKTHLETIAALSRSMEAKDYYTGGHTERVASVAVALARRLGFQGADLDALEVGALLHDIGKIGIPERILHKPGPLDDDEWRVMKEHPVISEYILAEVDLPDIVLQIARSSHERMDGAGYPDGLAGEEIPLAARIVLVADAFDALTSDRPYRRGRRMRDAIEELRAHRGTQFCPRVMNALESLYREEPHVLAGGELLHAVEVA